MMEGREFITVAERIVGFGPGFCRSATSRAYYGAFHIVLELLDELGCALPRNGKSHNNAHGCLSKASHQSGRDVGRLLADLHTRRLKADYRLDDRGVEELMFGMCSVEIARQIEQLVKEFRIACDADDSLKTQLVEAVRAHLAIIGGRRRKK
jgi:hypothetical protein